MARFVALPVGQGDAFFLERSKLLLLVDGGKSRSQVITYLAPLIPDRHLDLVICTHNDKDHAEGVRGLLESGTFSVGEVWLPGVWTDRLIDLCSDSQSFFEELAADVIETREDSLEALADNQDGLDAPEVQEYQALLDAIDQAEDRDPPLRYSYSAPLFQLRRNRLWVECINAAERIRAIAVAARNLGCRIRWFDYDSFASGRNAGGGGRTDLSPVNSVEITGARRNVRALRYLSLSVANRRSVVFRSSPDEQAPGVLFTADSDLGFRQEAAWQVAHQELVTAPHHGSESNANAYQVVESLAQSPATVSWARSDGRFHGRPGNAFLSKRERAACTRCRPQTLAGRCVEFVGSPNGWTLNSAACQCV